MFVKLALSFGYALLFILLRTDIVCSIGVQSVPTSLSGEHASSTTIKPLSHNETKNTSETKNITETSSTTQSIRINHNKTNIQSTTETPSLITPTVATTKVTDKAQHTNGSDDETAKHKKDHSTKDETRITHSTPTTPGLNSTSIHTTEKPKPTTDLSGTNESKSDFITEPKSKQPIETTTTAAGIVAIVCVGIAASAFLALAAWKYMYRKRHGNREILINEEDVDFNDEDLRHFEATCIQLEPDA